MELKNLFTPEAQQFWSQLAWVARKVAKPLEKPIQDIWQQFSANVQPAIQSVTDTVKTSFVDPVVKPIQKNNQRMKAVWDINTAFKGAWINIDDIKNLAEEEWIDFNLVLTKFQNNWIKVEGMEEMQVQPIEQQVPQQEWLADQFKMKSSEEFWVMEWVKDIWKFFVNLPADSAQVVWGLYDAVTSPVQTITWIANVWQWLADKAVYWIWNSIVSAFGWKEVPPTEQAQMIDAIAWNIKENYGTAWKFKKAIVENPADTLLTLMWGLWVVKNVAKAKNLTNVVSNIEKVEQVINPVNILKKEAQLVWKVTELPWKGIKKIGEALYKTAIKPNVAEAEKILQYKAWLWSKPTTVAETALKKWIAGTETRIGVQALKKADQIFKKEVNPILEKSKTEHDLWSLFNKAEKSIDSMKEGVLRKSELKEWLEALKEEYASLWSDKFTTKALQQEKSSLDKFTPDKVFRGKPIASSYNEAKNILANVFRDEVHTDLGKFWLKSQEAFRDYANLKELSKVGIKWLTDSWFKGGFGWFWTTMYEQATTPIKTIGGQVLYKVWDKLEFLWPKGINKLWDFLKDKFSIDKKGILVPKQWTNVNNPINSTSKTVPWVIKPVVKWVTPKKDSLQEKSIITPQTMEKWIIQESKQGISPNVKRPNGNINNTPNNPGNISVWNGIKPIVTPTVPKNTVNTPIVEKTATEVIKPKNSIYTSQEKAESYVKWHEKELQNPWISKKSITYLKKWLEDAKQEVELWKSLNKSNVKQQGIKPKSSDTIPEGYIENAFWEIQKNPSNKKVSPKAPIDKPMIQLLDEKTPWYIKNSLELAQSPTTMGRYISEILWKDIKNVSVKDISEFYKKYWPFPKWEKRLQDWVTWYEKWRMPWMSENGYKQDKLLLKAFYWK